MNGKLDRRTGTKEKDRDKEKQSEISLVSHLGELFSRFRWLCALRRVSARIVSGCGDA